MIKAVFFLSGQDVIGFSVKGHADQAEHGQDIVCAAVSSAVYMAANTVTDVFKAEADIEVDDGLFTLKLKKPDESSVNVLKGLKLHIEALQEQYPSYIDKTTEVMKC
ncbi:MAG: ribosomal-processing cysteine protease Prp [Acutalibacteraceae bacterium]|jgi:uncharacterized protein YsxB (DUF464 family)